MPGSTTLLVKICLLPTRFRLGVFLLLIGFSTAAQTLDEAQKLFRGGDYEAVIRAARERSDRLSTDWHTLFVQSLLMVGQYEEAHARARAAFEYSPMNLRTVLLAREAALYRNELTEANRRVSEARLIIERRGLAGQDGEGLVAAGEALLLLGVEPRLVLENCFRRAEQMSSPPREAFLATGRLGLEKRDFAVAAEAFRAGLKKFPDDADLQGGLARAFQTGDRKEMLRCIEAALALNPRHVPSLLLLTEHLIDSEQYDEAEAQAALVLKVNPSQPEALAFRAVLAHLRNDSAQEQQLRQAALKHWQSNPEVDHLIGRKLSEKYRFEEGAAAQRRALGFEPDYVPAQRQLAEDLLRLGQTDEGWKLAEAVHQRDEYDVTAYNLTTLRDKMLTFRTVTNRDFILRMSPREADLYGNRALALLDRARSTLCDKYGVQLDRPTVVEIFPEQKDFQVRTFGMPGNPGYLGVCFGSVITANSPASQAPDPSNWESVLWHEFCHVVTLNATRNRMPRWLSEGISVYEERQANPAWGENMNLDYREMILGEDFTPLSELSGAFLTPKSSQHVMFAYYESSLAVEYIVERFGLDAIRKILADLRNGREINPTIAAHTEDMEKLEKGFAAYCRDKAKGLAPGLDLDRPPGRGSESELLAWAAMHPRNYYVQMRDARQLMENKRWSDAKPVLEKLAEGYAGEGGAANPLWMLATVERQLGNTNGELAVLEKLAQREAGFVDLYARLIELAESREDWNAVANYSDRLMAVNPVVALPHRASARAAMALGRNDQAIAAYRALLLLNPPDPAQAHFQLGRLLHARGDAPAEAKRHVLRALEEAPRFREAQQLLLEIRARTQRTATSNEPPAS
jgi:tetratricopeptide (TPR) repeat protein